MHDVKNLIENGTKSGWWDPVSNLMPYGVNITRNFTCANPVIVNSGVSAENNYMVPISYLYDILNGVIDRPGILPPLSDIPKNLSSVIIAFSQCGGNLNFSFIGGCRPGGGSHSSMYAQYQSANDTSNYNSFGYIDIFMDSSVNYTLQSPTLVHDAAWAVMHELAEFATDPLFDGMGTSHGYEIADLCSIGRLCQIPGDPLYKDYNINISGSLFTLTELFDNYQNRCSFGSQPYPC